MKKLTKNCLTIVLICLFSFSQVNLTIQAQEKTASAEPTISEEVEQTSTQNLKERIERVVKEKSEVVKGTIDDLSAKKQGFIGQVERVTDESISIKTIKDTRIVAINDSIKLLKDNKEIKLEEIAVNDWLTVMGVVTNDTFAAKRILVSTQSIRPPEYTVNLGTIQTINKNSLDFKNRDNEEITLTLQKSTSYQNLDGEKIEQADLAENIQALIIYFTQTNKDETETKLIKVVRALSLLSSDETDK